MTVTEVGCMGVKPSLDIMNETTREGQILARAWKAVIAAPEGPNRVYWGLEQEDPLKLWAFFDWNSVEDHEKFAKSFDGEAVKELPNILSFSEFVKHVAMAPPSALIVQSPITQVILAYFPSDISSARKEAAAASLKEIVEQNFKNCSDITHVNYGQGLENDFPVRGGAKAQTGTVLFALIGWSSTAALTKFQETESFKKGVSSMHSIEDLLQVNKAHISCRTLERNSN